MARRKASSHILYIYEKRMGVLPRAIRKESIRVYTVMDGSAKEMLRRT
jgi:hypothetical protein